MKIQKTKNIYSEKIFFLNHSTWIFKLLEEHQNRGDTFENKIKSVKGQIEEVYYNEAP